MLETSTIIYDKFYAWKIKRCVEVIGNFPNFVCFLDEESFPDRKLCLSNLLSLETLLPQHVNQTSLFSYTSQLQVWDWDKTQGYLVF